MKIVIVVKEGFNIRKIYTNRAVTRLSGEQVIIDQLHGSTESSSQLFSAPCGSITAFFILIKASTATLLPNQLFLLFT